MSETTYNLNSFLNQISELDDALKVLLSDVHRAYLEKDYDNGRRIATKILTFFQASKPLSFIDAVDWFNTEPPEPEQILPDLIDAGDKGAIIGSSKLRKSFFLFQLVISLAAGKPFLDFSAPQPRRVAYLQFEIRDHHAHRRFKRLCGALDVTAGDIQDRLLILNGRGLGLSGQEGIERVMEQLSTFKPEVIAFDPLYKLATGAENSAEDMKVTLEAFDRLAETTGAAVLYTHHDTKGSPGDRDIRDRGAGSNVLGRDYDFCMTLTAHADDEDVTVLDFICRNYAPRESLVIQWTTTAGGGYAFRPRPDILPTKRTLTNAKRQPSLDTYLPVANEILSAGPMETIAFKNELKKRTGMSARQTNEFMKWAVCGGNPKIVTREERCRGHYKIWAFLPS